MILDPAPVHLVLTRAEATALDEQLADAVRWAYLVRQARPPRVLLAFADTLHTTVAEHRDQGVTSTSGGVIAPEEETGSSSGQPEWLTTTEASKYANISAGYVRELARKREVRTSWSARGAWLIGRDSLEAWAANREARTREAA